MNLGTAIKMLRQQRDLTQEQLAEYLNVSISAVSQWESGKTVPDVSTLPVIADFFDVSLDNLFDRTSTKKEQQIKIYEEQSLKYMNKGETEKNLALWREAVQKYPGDFTCLNALASALFLSPYNGCEKERAEKDAKECIAICERILRDCKDTDIRDGAIQNLVLLYSTQQLSFASEEKAEKYAMMAGNIYTCRESLLEHVYFTEESKEKRLEIKHGNILTYMDLLTQNLYYGEYDTVDDRINACHAAVSMWRALIYDGNYLFYHVRLQAIYLTLARLYASQKKREETIDSLKKAFYHAKMFENHPEGEQHLTSVFVRAVTSDASKCTKNYSGTNTDEVKEMMKIDNTFDFLRNDEEFIALEM